MLWLVQCLLFLGYVGTTKLPSTCQHVKYAYSERGVLDEEIPGQPVSASNLQICPSAWSGPSCCTKTVEKKLGVWSETQYKDALFNKTIAMAATLDAKATQVDDFIYALLLKAQREFHEMFTRTYGIIYQKNADVFQEYFRELKKYYDRGNINLADSTQAFFETLYQRMFQVLNAQYKFDNPYLTCVAEHMDSLKPFGDVPRKMSSSVKRSLVAARTLVKSLRAGHSVANQMTKMESSGECLKAVRQMSSCPACQGLPDVRPCNGYCINIMKGCMAFHYEMHELWEHYIDSLMSLSERLVGPFNIEMTIEPISIKISDAIMNFQESGFQVTQKVFELCGTPRLGKREARSSPFVFEKQLEPAHRAPGKHTKSEFEKMILELKKNLKGVEEFWSDLPYQMCDSQLEKPYNLEDRGHCWNGETAGPYNKQVIRDGLVNQMENPEVPVAKGFLSHTLLDEQKFRLQELSNQLQAAYKGQDIEWIDEEEEDGGMIKNAKQGSGDGDYVEGSGDDEDYENNYEGSGGDYDTPIVMPDWHHNKDPVDKYPTRVKFPPTHHPTTHRTVVGSGTGSVHLKSKWALTKAIITYMLPVATCYLGGAMADLPGLFPNW